MATITFTAKNIEAHRQAIVIREKVAVAVDVGEAVVPHADGWKPADASTGEDARARGVVIGSGVLGTTFPAGAMVDICVFGPVSFPEATMTVNGLVYVSATAGALDQTAPAVATDQVFAVGRAKDATVLFVDPQSAEPTVVS